VQNIPHWELEINKLSKQGVKLIITGSNANLLSQELGTHLTGRYQEIQLLPLSWREYCSWYKNTPDLNDYLRQGGYPELLNSGIDLANYLNTLANSILLKDIVQRYKLRQATQLSQLWQALKGQFAQQFTISKLARSLDFKSKITLQNYLSYIQNTYLLCELQRYHSKLKIQLKAPRKIYLIDTGFTSTLSLPFDANSRILENAIFLGLKRYCESKSLNLFYALTNDNYEIDFIVRSENKTLALIQVCYTLDNPNTRERELRALELGKTDFNCDNLILVTANGVTTEGRLSQSVRIKNFKAEDFLLDLEFCLKD
jgi:predicted AAA+ superfamily ATPase